MKTTYVRGRVYNFSHCIGRNAVGGNGFINPMDFAVAPDGALCVVNRGFEVNLCLGVTKCTLDHEFLWDSRGGSYADGLARWPTSVDVDSDGNLYVSDEYTNKIVMMDKVGNFQGSWGAKGSDAGELWGPSGLAFDAEDNLLVVDSLNHRVQKFTKEGKFLATWGGLGSGEGQFNMPWGLAIDRQGDVYVADWKNDRVQKFSPDGGYLATFGGPGSGLGELRRPSGVAIDKDGDVYVTDWGNNLLNIYEADGTFLTAFTGDADHLSGWAQDMVDASPDYYKGRLRADLSPERWFYRPVAVNVADTGNIMVLEVVRNRIQVYVKEQEWVEPQFNL